MAWTKGANLTMNLAAQQLEYRPGGAWVPTWDDAYASHLTIGQTAASLGQSHTFYCTYNLLGTASHLTTSSVTALYVLGHEIGSHNMDHLDMRSASPGTLTYAQRQAQLINSKTNLESLTATGAVINYAWPYGYHDATVDVEAFGIGYEHAADVGNDSGYQKPPWLLRKNDIADPFTFGRYPWTQTNHPRMLALMRQAARLGFIFTTYAHDSSDGTSPTLTQINEAMNLAATLRLPVLRVQDVYASPNLLVNGDFETGDLTGWTTMSASGMTNSGSTPWTVVNDSANNTAGAKQTYSSLVTIATADAATSSFYGSQVVPIHGGDTYLLSGKVKVAGISGTGAGYQLRAYPINGAGATVGTAGTSTAITSTTYVQATASVTPPVTATSLRIDLLIQAVAGSFYADRLVLTNTKHNSVALA